MRKLCTSVHNTLLFHTLQAHGAKDLVTGIILTFILIQPFIRQVQRVMHSREREVCEKGFVIFGVVDVLDDLVSVELTGEKALRYVRSNSVLPVYRSIIRAHHPLVIKVAGPTLQHCKGLLKSAIKGVILDFFAQMPLASHVGMIPSVTQEGGNCHDAIIDVSFVTWFTLLVLGQSFFHIAKPCQMIICPTHQHGPSRRASR